MHWNPCWMIRLKPREMGLLGHHAVAQNYANEKLASRLVEEIISPSQHAII